MATVAAIIITRGAAVAGIRTHGVAIVEVATLTDIAIIVTAGEAVAVLTTTIMSRRAADPGTIRCEVDAVGVVVDVEATTMAADINSRTRPPPSSTKTTMVSKSTLMAITSREGASSSAIWLSIRSGST